MTARRRLAGFLALTLVTLALTFGVAAPAEAAPQQLVLSSDGVNFSRVLPTGVFQNAGRLVPLDTYATSVWVKNPTLTDSQMRISVADLLTSSDVFASNMTLTATEDATGATVTKTLLELKTCDVIVTSQVVQPGAVVRVDLTLAMSDVPAKVAQDRWWTLDLFVGMRDGEAGPFPDSACKDGAVLLPGQVDESTGSDNGSGDGDGNDTADGGLAATGSEIPTHLIMGSALLIGVAIFLLVWRRRRNDEEAAEDRENSVVTVDALLRKPTTRKHP